jgi:hypothetical protein
MRTVKLKSLPYFVGQVFLFCWLVGCSWQQRQESLQKSDDLVLNYTGQGFVHRLDVYLEGYGYGQMTLLSPEGVHYQSWHLNGAFSERYRGDWYQPQALLRWRTTHLVNSQQYIQLRYRFSD